MISNKQIKFIENPVIQTFWERDQFDKNELRTPEQMNELYKNFKRVLDFMPDYINYSEENEYLKIIFPNIYSSIDEFIDVLNKIMNYIDENNIYHYLDGTVLFQFTFIKGDGIVNFNWKTKNITFTYRRGNSLKSELKEKIVPYTTKSFNKI